MKPLFTALLLFALTSLGSLGEDQKSDDDWVFLDNGTVKIGVLRNRGAGIAWLSKSGSEKNLVNHWDHGRLIQQSYYGKTDGSLWNKQPWRWNPVQGGDWQGNPAKVLEFELAKDRQSLYTKTRGRHWAACRDLEEVVFEQWITLEGPLAKIRFRFTYSGKEPHPVHDQEIPAVFVAPDLDTLVVADGEGKLMRSKPGWPNESRDIPKKWAAYIHPKTQHGIGVHVAAAEKLTCYRFGDGDPQHASCSYFAPLVRFAVTPGKVFEYEAVLTLGTIDEIQGRFAALPRRAARSGDL